MRTLVGRLVVVLALFVGATACMSTEERTFFDRVDAERVSRGVPALHENVVLDLKAQAWAHQMASEGGIRHSKLTDGLDALAWLRVGENVGFAGPGGDTLMRLHQAFMASHSHFHTLMDAGYTQMGVGVAWSDDGTLYVSEVFAQVR